MKMVSTGLIVSMIFLSVITLGQVKEQEPKKIIVQKKTAETYLDLMVNVVSTNLNYGAANSAVADYKKSVHGIQAGASFQAGITAGFSIVSELYFMKKGGKLKSNNPFSTNESDLRINTLEVPLLARFHFGKFYMNAGPSIAYNLSGNRKVDNLSTKLTFANSSEGFKRFDAGVQMGGGLELPFKQRRIALDIRYSYGLTNVAYDKEIHNRAVMISVHFSKCWKSNPVGRNKGSWN